MSTKSRSLKNQLTGSTALVAAALLVMSAPTTANAAQVIISGPGNTQQTLVMDDELIVNSGATISDDPAVIVSGVNATSILNNGTIEGTASGGAIQLDTAGSLTGSFTNRGVISVNIDDTTSFNSTVIDIDDFSVDGALTNSGTISGTIDLANTGTSLQGTIYAIDALDLTLSSFSNSGTISVASDVDAGSSSANAYAYALYISNGTNAVTGNFVNSGTVSANATAMSTTAPALASAYAVYLEDLAIGGAFTNSKTISATSMATSLNDDATAGAGVVAEAYGIYANSNNTFDSFTNTSNGTISVISTANGGTSSARVGAYGVYMNDTDITNSLTNAGTIAANATASVRSGSSAPATAYGLYYDSGTIGGNVTNSGSISATARAETLVNFGAKPDAYGSYFSSSTITGAFSNTGSISAIGTAISKGSSSSADADVRGAYFDSTTMGSFTNDGTITATADAQGEAYSATADATGVYLDSSSDVTGAFTNNGTITATAAATNDDTNSSPEANAYGGRFTSSDLGSFLNTGTISATSTALNQDTDGGYFASAQAYGLNFQSSDVTGAFSNQGTISAMAMADPGEDSYGSPTARGISISSSTFDSLSNSGMVSATADADGFDSAEADATAIRLAGTDVTNMLTNSGTISATVTADVSGTGTAGVEAFGIEMTSSSDIAGGLMNTGSITASGTGNVQNGSSVNIQVAGVRVNSSDISGGFDNDGTITATATGNQTSGNASAFGLDVDGGADITGVINNSGTISASATGGTTAVAAGINIDNAEITGGIVNSGTISGGTDGFAIRMINLGAATPITLNGGSLIGDVFDDAIANGFSDTTINADIMTQGDWTVSDLVVSAGNTLTISNSNIVEIDDMSASAGTFNFAVADATTAGTLIVSGAGNDVDLTGATITASVTGAGLVDGDEILIANGVTAITGGPGATLTDIDDDSFLFSFQIADGTAATAATDNTDLFLFTTQESTIEDAATSTGNSNFGAVLDTLSASADPEIQAAIGAINNATTQAELNTILEDLQPAVDGGAFSSALNVTTSSLGINRTQLASLRTGETGMAAGSIPQGVRFWGQAFGALADQDNRDGVSGYEADTYGLAVGVDTANLNDRAVVGLSFSYADTDVDSNSSNNASTDIDSYQIALYGDYDLSNDTYISGMLAYTMHDNDTVRSPLAGIVANGDYDADQFTIRSEIGRDFQKGSTTLTPSFMAHWTHYNPDSYTETGAGGLNATVDGDSLNIFELVLSVDASWEHMMGNGGVLVPELNAGYRYDLIGDEFSTTTALAGGGASFKSQGFDPAQSTFALGAGVTYYDTKNWELTAEYDFEIKEDYDSHAGLLRAAYKF